MITQVFTFGYGHVCPYTGQSLAEHYATIVAPDKEQCRAAMVAMFGNQWAFQYDSVEAATPPWLKAPLVEHVRLEIAAGVRVCDATDPTRHAHIHRCSRRVDPTVGTHLGDHQCGDCPASFTTEPPEVKPC